MRSGLFLRQKRGSLSWHDTCSEEFVSKELRMRKILGDVMIYPMTGALMMMEWTIDKIKLPQNKRVKVLSDK